MTTPERKPHTIIKIESNPIYQKWRSWVKERLDAFQLDIVTSYDPLNKIVIFRVVDIKSYSQLTERGVLVSIKIPENMKPVSPNEELTEETLHVGWNIHSGSFDRANPLKQAASSAFAVSHINVALSSLLGSKIDDPEKYLDELKERYTNMFLAWNSRH